MGGGRIPAHYELDTGMFWFEGFGAVFTKTRRGFTASRELYI